MKKIITRSQMPLGRHVNHDLKSLSFGFDTSGLSIIDVEHKRLIPILNQGQLPSCTGNAGIGNINTEPFIQNPSPYYSLDEVGAIKLWSDALKIDGGVGYPPQETGSSGLSIAKALLNAKVISGYQHIFTLNDALKALSLYPIISGMNWYVQMFTPDIDGRARPTGTIAGGHEIEAFKVDVANGRIWFHNSWGSDWGVNGDFYLTWADFAYLMGQQGDVTILIPPSVTPPAPAPVRPVLRLGSTGSDVIILQNDLNKDINSGLVADGSFGPKTQTAVKAFQTHYNLYPDGVVGPRTWRSLDMVDIITKVCIQNGIEPLVLLSVATCESALDPKSSLYNPGSASTDRGLLQWNSKYHAEISDADAFDPVKSIEWGCKYLNQNKANLHGFWSASQSCWKPKLTPSIITEYGL